jgi:hypothetical protein
MSASWDSSCEDEDLELWSINGTGTATNDSASGQSLMNTSVAAGHLIYSQLFGTYLAVPEW